MKHQPFTTTLTAETSYRLGEPVLIKFEIENTGSESYQILKWGTPLEGKLTADCFNVEFEGENVPYDGKLVKRGDPPAEAYEIIGPGIRLTKTVDIADTYAINRAGNYKVTLNAAFFDAHAVPGNAKQAPRKRQNHESHKLPTASVQFKVVDGAEPKLTA